MAPEESESGTQQRLGSDSTRVFKPEWADSTDIDKWLQREMFVGEVLNFPCGVSPLGDVRVDIDPSVNPDILADIESVPFEDSSFDTVYCDPPYSYHAYDKNQWAVDLWDVARKRLILQTKNQRYAFEHADRTVYLAERPSRGMVYQIFQVFDLRSKQLTEYAGGVSDGVR